jgi:cysteine dioxygenase|uniref:Cysteine dioxygenase type I n=1 Tax=Mimiviridae sp. ChoanoV1 TaxID=2596887 RepID=A0A5B8IQF8_9VIRU|nr:cysteine dioxygenase type I [Mimiviridae sp. ChoanoV1]
MNRLITTLKNYNSFKNYHSLYVFKDVLKNYSSSDYKNYVSFCQENYKKNLFYSDNNLEAFIVCWEPYQETKIHNHSDNGCILKILEGNINEILYNKDLKILKKNILPKNDIRYIDDNIGYHKMINGKEKTISLHIYSPPNFVPKISI